MTFFGESRFVYNIRNSLNNQESYDVVDEVQSQGIKIGKSSERSQVLIAKDEGLTQLKRALDRSGHDSLDINDSIRANNFAELIASLSVSAEDIKKLVTAVESAEKRGEGMGKKLDGIAKSGLLSDAQYDSFKARMKALQDAKVLDTNAVWQLEQDMIKTAKRLPEHAAVKSKFDAFGGDENVQQHFEATGATFTTSDGKKLSFADLAAGGGKIFGNLTFKDKKAVLAQTQGQLKKTNFDPKAAEKAVKLLSNDEIPDSHKAWLEADDGETLSYKVHWLEKTGIPELQALLHKRQTLCDRADAAGQGFDAYAKKAGVDISTNDKEYLAQNRETREAQNTALEQALDAFEAEHAQRSQVSLSEDASAAQDLLAEQGTLALMEAEAEQLAVSWLQKNLQGLDSIRDQDIASAVDQKKAEQQQFEAMGAEAQGLASLRQQSSAQVGFGGRLRAFFGADSATPEAANDSGEPAVDTAKAAADKEAQTQMDSDDKLAAEYVAERCNTDQNVQRDVIAAAGLREQASKVQKDPAHMERLSRMIAVRNDKEKLAKMMKDTETRRLMFHDGNLLEGAKKATMETWQKAGKLGAANEN